MVQHICQFQGCEATFSKPSRLKSHFRTHTGERPYVCLIENCLKSYAHANNLRRHVKESHSDTAVILKCEICNKSFKLINELKCHYKKYKGKGLSCQDQQENNSPNSEKKSSINNNKQVVQDDDDGKRQTDANKTDDDEKTNEQSKEEMTLILCTEFGCASSFQSNDAFQKHLKNYHESRKFKCGYCNKLFRKHQHLKIHEYEHTNVKPFKCEKCDKSFLLPSKLKAHQKIHQGYICTEADCGLKFEKWTDLRRHKKIVHPTEYLCAICNKTFLSKSNLRSHTTIHQSEREAFHCPHDNCVRYYFFMNNLSQHIKSIHEKHRFHCEHDGCTKSYKKKKNLVEHEQLHKPNYVPPIKKERRKRQPNSMINKLSGIKSKDHMDRLKQLAPKVESADCIADISAVTLTDKQESVPCIHDDELEVSEIKVMGCSTTSEAEMGPVTEMDMDSVENS